ncbi:class I SAM-dependent methyltransferase [Halocatena pleomorpha]|uniref:Class I SAM-dependent methyltransferase family protein n=1 Tax=Halocatena pleomorpha TaxID=1785090 RepID=A0A3P3RF12_9EURY|nr:class I SAM-dependent methyltransferase family protein [Halocatena pleomorpha]RRJ31995.1 class I SAM-dependent methyltransferase family protein [Halocatena pleomorpha]
MNEVPCVRVRPSAGEETRQKLAGRDLLHPAYEITVSEGWLYIPVVAVPDGYTVEEHAVPERDQQTMPADVLGFEPSYTRLGDIAILDEDDPDRAREIADALVASDLPLCSVLNRASKVKGELRVREWDVLAGETTTVHREYGTEFALDLEAVYFSPRLATERHRVIEQVQPDEQFIDMFAGVGPFVVPAAARGANTVGVDLNPVAIEFLEENADRNGVTDRVTAINADVREIDYTGWADRIVMNLPHSADAFLDTAVRLAGDECLLHYYDIQHEDDPFGPGERAIRAAASGYSVTVETRHTVRSYAPHELNVCLDVRLSQ